MPRKCVLNMPRLTKCPLRFNYIGTDWMIRNYSYTGLAMLRVLHDSRYFCGVSSSPKNQMIILEQYINECLKVRGSGGGFGQD